MLKKVKTKGEAV
jgi:hypothetical protein